MKYIYEILDKIYKKEINVRQLSKETGISEAKMYKWQGRGSKKPLAGKDKGEMERKWLSAIWLR